MYPQNRDEWIRAIHKGIDLSSSDGQKLWEAGNFPYQQLENWIREAFKEGFSSDFVPALLRNIQGLVAWVYGEGSEPYWPESDLKT